MNISITGEVYSIDPIFSPVGYAKSVFQENIDKVEWRTEGKCMSFTVISPVNSNDIPFIIDSLVPDVVNGRKVNFNIEVVV